MRTRAVHRVLIVGAFLCACGSAPTASPGAEAPPPDVVAQAPIEEPARPADDPPEAVPVFDDETEGLDLEPFEGGASLSSDDGRTIGWSGPDPCPFPARRAGHRELLGDRGSATQAAVLAELAFLRERALPGGGWSAGGLDPDVALTSLGVLACFSIGHARTDPRERNVVRAACKWLTRDWLARGNGTLAKDRPSHRPAGLRDQALLTLALSEWRGLTWVVFAKDDGALSLATLEQRTLANLAPGSVVSSEEAATDAAWTLLALHVARLAEFEVDGECAGRIVAALDLAPATAPDERTVAARAVARAIAVSFHRTGATRDDVRTALAPAMAFAVAHPSEFERASDRMFLVSVAAMQVGGADAREWNRRVLRPLAARPRATDVRESALAAMCLSSPYRYVPAARK